MLEYWSDGAHYSTTPITPVLQAIESHENTLGVTIRPAMPEDAEAIAEILRESYRYLPADHVPAELPGYRAETHLALLEDADTRWALLQEDSRRVGVAMWRMLPGLSHLHLLYVHGDHHGRGYGRLLLKHHQDEARIEQPELRLFTLHCLRDSTWAMRFYKHQGYALYRPGDEGRVMDLILWIDACSRHDDSWPLRKEKALFYKQVK